MPQANGSSSTLKAMRAALLLLTLLALPLRAEDPPMEVNPNRPTFATPAQTTQWGLIELETGGQRALARDQATALGTPTMVKLGVLENLEIRLSTPGFQRLAAPGTKAVSGPGDLSLGAQWCYLKDGWLGWDQAIQVTHTFPTAAAAQGLGSGEPSDLLMLLFSRDLGAFHVDVNVLQTWIGRPAAAGGGRVAQPAATCALSRSLGGAWSLAGEVYAIGATELNPRIVSNLWAVGYKVSPRLILDAGLDLGLTTGAPKLTMFAGLTVGLGRFRHAR